MIGPGRARTGEARPAQLVRRSDIVPWLDGELVEAIGTYRVLETMPLSADRVPYVFFGDGEGLRLAVEADPLLHERKVQVRARLSAKPAPSADETAEWTPHLYEVQSIEPRADKKPRR